jgi:hypothetical protein
VYDILREGDRHLRGKIAELVFDKVKFQLIREPLYCCTTYKLCNFIRAIRNDISSYIEALNIAREFLGMKRLEETFNILFNKEVGGNLLRGRCLLCLEEGEAEVRIRVEDVHTSFRLCKSCLHVCMEKGLIIQSKSRATLSCKARTNPRKLRNLIEKLVARASWIEYNFSKYSDVVEVLSKLDERARRFLWEVDLGPKGPGQYSFDYVCVDDRGGKYLIDVTSVRGLDASPASFSEKERWVAERAREVGFKILKPVVRFLRDWRVLVELIEA